MVNDPLGQGFIANQARPGGNITGFTFVEFPMIGKWLELLKEIAPSIKRIRLLFNPQTAAYYPLFLREFGASAASLAAQVSATPVRDGAEIELRPWLFRIVRNRSSMHTVRWLWPCRSGTGSLPFLVFVEVRLASST